MRMILITVLGALAITACTETEKRVATGGAIGAGTGALVGAATGANVAGAALVGAGVGALVGYATRPGYCRYRRSDGTIYEAPCR